MPELPEVQTTVDGLIKANIIGKTIIDCLLDHLKIIEPFSIEEFKKVIVGNSIKKVFRKGKYIFFELKNKWHMVVHLRMSGKFINTNILQLEKHEHAAFNFSNGVILKFHDPRKFGKITLTKDTAKVLSKIGMDALDPALTENWLKEHILTKKKMLKALLLDQRFIAGIGNIYADEILFDSGLHPQVYASSLDDEKIGNLYRSIKEIIKKAVKNKGTSLGSGLSNFKSFNDQGKHQNHLAVYGKKNEPCKKCGNKIIKFVVCQRGTYVCPKCQAL